jgi:hypothetical protein
MYGVVAFEASLTVAAGTVTVVGPSDISTRVVAGIDTGKSQRRSSQSQIAALTVTESGSYLTLVKAEYWSRVVFRK